MTAKKKPEATKKKPASKKAVARKEPQALDEEVLTRKIEELLAKKEAEKPQEEKWLSERERWEMERLLEAKRASANVMRRSESVSVLLGAFALVLLICGESGAVMRIPFLNLELEYSDALFCVFAVIPLVIGRMVEAWVHNKCYTALFREEFGGQIDEWHCYSADELWVRVFSKYSHSDKCLRRSHSMSLMKSQLGGSMIVFYGVCIVVFAALKVFIYWDWKYLIVLLVSVFESVSIVNHLNAFSFESSSLPKKSH